MILVARSPLLDTSHWRFALASSERAIAISLLFLVTKWWYSFTVIVIYRHILNRAK